VSTDDWVAQECDRAEEGGAGEWRGVRAFRVRFACGDSPLMDLHDGLLLIGHQRVLVGMACGEEGALQDAREYSLDDFLTATTYTCSDRSLRLGIRGHKALQLVFDDVTGALVLGCCGAVNRTSRS
jgi:hypothetical protein